LILISILADQAATATTEAGKAGVTMTANVETMAFKGKTPWHGVGNALTDPTSVEATLADAGAGWYVGRRKMVLQNDTSKVVPGYAMVREDNEKILGVVGKSYRELQNSQAFDFFRPYVEGGFARFETAGVLDEGRHIWALAELLRDPIQIGKDDIVRKFLLLSNSHDGSRAVRVGFTPIRVVCANTLAGAIRDKRSQLLRIRHSTTTVSTLEKVRETVDVVDQSFKATAEVYASLQSKDINAKDLRRYIKILFKHAMTPDAGLPGIAKNKINAVEELFENDRQKHGGAGGTWWAAYNAYAEYINYSAGRSTNTRLRSLWLDGGDNQKALDTAIAMALSA
jgi:phage/plasmid-like protein (TIGR03299 family)